MVLSSASKSASIVYNPIARGLARHFPSLQRSIGTLASHGIHAKLVATEAAGTAGEQARREIESGAELILAAGGDGTINEVAAGLLHTGVPMGILPGGTANVLAREMRIPISLERVAASISSMKPHPVSVGTLSAAGSSPRPFLCMTGAGLDAEIVSRVSPQLKVKTGKLAYYVSGFSHFFTPLPEFDVAVDGRTYRASFALVSRVRNYGGDLEIARNASLLRDDFEVVLFRGTDRIRYLPYLLGVAMRQVHRLSGCTILHGHHVSCSAAGSKGVYVQVDGELAGNLPASVDILPNALTMLLPDQYVAREKRYTSERVCA